MSVSEGSPAEGEAPGLPQLGLRLVAGAAMIVVGLLVAQQWGAGDRQARESFALVDGTIRLSQATTPVEVLRDDRGVPHLFARREADAWLALGFVHGQDRLAQMDWLRRRALGRSAELLGAEALPADRLARLLEIGRAAEAAVEILPDSTRAVLEAYAAGVNARIDRLRQGRVAPPLPLVGGVEPLENWRPADSLAIGKLLSWCAGGTLETTLVLDDLIHRLDSVPARPFFPGRASVDFGVAPDLPRHPLPLRPAAAAAREALAGSTRALCRGLGIPTGGAWVLDGSVTESGAPILVADWHLEPTIPALFYEAHLVSGPLRVAGATIPGSPVFWTGRSREFAWAGVPASAPISDLFIETLREDRGLYQNGTLWTPIDERTETLRWRDPRGGLQSSTLTIRSTRHGPLIESLHEAATPQRGARPHATGRALAWTGALPGDGLTTMLGLLRLRSAEGLEALLAEHHEPVLAIAFADRSGQGGVQLAGWLPSRPLPTGLVPVQGRLRSFDWRERVAIEDLPGERLADRARPWVLALDQPWPGRGGLDQLEWLWRPGDRAARLEALLEPLIAAGPIDLRDAAGLLGDDRAQRAPRVAAAIVGLARRGGPLPVEAREVAALLERWDGSAAADSAGAAAYHLLIEHLLERLLREPFGDPLYARYLEAPHVRPQTAIERLVQRAARLRRAGGWTDEVRVTEAVRDSLRAVWVSLSQRLGPSRERWAWGGLHRLRFEPLLRQRSVASAEARRFAAAGSGQTLAFARHRPGLSFDVDRVALYRMAVDLGSPDGLLSALAPGQSEHPGHPQRLDGIARWSAPRLPLFETLRLSIEEGNVQRLLLEPAP